MMDYLTQGGPFHTKHGGGLYVHNNKVSILPPLHPFLAFLVHYSIAISTIFAVHDNIMMQSHDETTTTTNRVEYDDEATTTTLARRQAHISTFLFIYTSILFTARYLSSYHAGRLRHYSVLYEFNWLCNSTLVMSCISYGTWNNTNQYWLFRRRPLIATSCCVAVSIDQILWYVDLVVWSITGRFPFGVIKYLTWKQTLWIDRFTCTHHLWTIPLLLYGGANNPITWKSFYLSVYIVTCHVMLSRWLTPHVIQCYGTTTMTSRITDNNDCSDRGEKGNLGTMDPNYYRYLNVNLSHELWKDITIPFLQISKDNPTPFKYFIRLLTRWNLFNALVFAGILLPLSWVLN